MVALVKRRVHLYGHLAEAFGPHFDLAVRSPAEAIRLLEANFPGQFCNAVREGSYAVVVGDTEHGISIKEEFVPFNFPQGDFHLIPVPEGAGGGGKGKGILMIILGIALIATAFVGAGVFAGAGLAGLGTASGIGVSWSTIALLGVGIALAGVAQLLTPTPKKDEDNKKSTDSFFFNGAGNTVTEGGPVPLVYGHVVAGSVVVSTGVTTAKIDPMYQWNAYDTSIINSDLDGVN